MSLPQISWTVVFGLLGLWAAYATAHWYKPVRRWAPARKMIFVGGLALTASCALMVAGLVTHRFMAWMFAPFGVIYALMVFLPCTFADFNRVKVLRRARDVLFVAIALFCFAVALGILPTHYLGLP
jgi:hypothetical protein